jgi:hypothetical protein
MINILVVPVPRIIRAPAVSKEKAANGGLEAL